jgi:HAD superfamily hydrolase (TIGR01509 family)
MKKLIIFDLDGVLVEAKNIHFDALNKALGEKYAIDWNEHLSLYDGLKTTQKLEMLTERKGLPANLYKKIWEDKQRYTTYELSNLKESESLKSCISELVKDGYKLAVCSNSIRKTVIVVLSRLGIIENFDLILSNEDVKNSKPHPEIYWNAMSNLKTLPEETLIVEDSPYGLLAASRSKADIMRVVSPNEVTYENIKKHLNREIMNTTPKWRDEKLNVLIPMAGAGSRFEQAG